jgi:hypothetical protein
VSRFTCGQRIRDAGRLRDGFAAGLVAAKARRQGLHADSDLMERRPESGHRGGRVALLHLAIAIVTVKSRKEAATDQASKNEKAVRFRAGPPHR